MVIDRFRVVGVENARQRGERTVYSCASRHAASTQQCRPRGGGMCPCRGSSCSPTQSHWVCTTVSSHQRIMTTEFNAFSFIYRAAQKKGTTV